jgi:tricorn protease
VAWSPDGKASVGFLMRRINWLFQINLEEQNKIAIENPTFYYKPSWSPDSKYLSFYNENRTLWIVEVSTGKFTEIATEGFTHRTCYLWRMGTDSKWIATPKG